MCIPYGFGRQADMTETPPWPITISGVWIPMVAPTCSTMISSDEPRCQGLNQSRIQFPLFSGMVLARDSIVGIPIPCSISLPASHFTRFVTHHPVINSLVTFAQMMMSYRVGPEIPLRLHGVTNSSLDPHKTIDTFGDTCSAPL